MACWRDFKTKLCGKNVVNVRRSRYKEWKTRIEQKATCVLVWKERKQSPSCYSKKKACREGIPTSLYRKRSHDSKRRLGDSPRTKRDRNDKEISPKREGKQVNMTNRPPRTDILRSTERASLYGAGDGVSSRDEEEGGSCLKLRRLKRE